MINKSNLITIQFQIRIINLVIHFMLSIYYIFNDLVIFYCTLLNLQTKMYEVHLFIVLVLVSCVEVAKTNNIAGCYQFLSSYLL